MTTHPGLIETTAGAFEVLRSTRRIAVLGIKTERQPGQPALYVPAYLQNAGYEIIPVPVFYPEVTRILDAPVYRRVADVPPPVDLVLVFRRPRDLPGHLVDLLAAAPAAVWFQTGIRENAVALALAESGIRVVQNRCAMVDHRMMKLSEARQP
ncbi:MAG: CoA-binding protein [Gemmatimonadota bacterium]|jgi:predicted CoA-binding protein|nr:CoA-binding protein [Gemmatimonadota bacterium]